MSLIGLTLQKKNSSIKKEELGILDTSTIFNVYKADGILGILQLGVLDFLIYVTDSLKVGSIGTTDIYLIKKIDYITLMPKKGSISLPKEILLILNNV